WFEEVGDPLGDAGAPDGWGGDSVDLVGEEALGDRVPEMTGELRLGQELVAVDQPVTVLAGAIREVALFQESIRLDCLDDRRIECRHCRRDPSGWCCPQSGDH